jgi:hypothetical protein
MVEGQARLSRHGYSPHHRLQITKHFARRNPQRLDPMRRKPRVAARIVFRSIGTLVHLTINFDSKPCITAIEIEGVIPAWMLSAELKTIRPPPQNLPQHDFGRRHGAAQAARLIHRSSFGFWRYVPKDHFPSTMLRMVPLPETSSGRI